MTNLDSILKRRVITWPTKGHIVRAMVFPVVMYGSESWTIKKAEHQRIDAFELWCWRLLRVPGLRPYHPERARSRLISEAKQGRAWLVLGWESPWGCKEIQPVHPKGNQSWIFIGKTNAEAEAPILWPPDAKSWLIRKDPDAGKDWGQKEKGMAEDEMAEWHRQLNEHEFEWTPGVGEGQGSLACCGPWGRKESDTTERQQHSNKVRKEKGRKDWLEK